MTTGTFVRINCRGCGTTSTVPVDALLVSVAVEDATGENAGLDAVDEPDPGPDDVAGTVAWTCDPCADLVTAALDWRALLALVTAGATLLDDASDDLPPHPEHPAGGTPLSRDDLLALHELLASDSWFDQVIPAG
jgi:hypothetical protein